MRADLRVVVLVALLPVATRGVASECETWKSPSADSSFTACSSSGVTAGHLRVGENEIAVVDVDQSFVDANIVEAVWSPSSRFVALDAGLDEASTIYLVNVKDGRATDVGLRLASAGVDPEHPTWHPSGDWLVFNTTGAGASRRYDGVYALRVSDMSVRRLYLGQVRGISIAGDKLSIRFSEGAASTTQSFAALLRTGVTVPAGRERSVKE